MTMIVGGVGVVQSAMSHKMKSIPSTSHAGSNAWHAWNLSPRNLVQRGCNECPPAAMYGAKARERIRSTDVANTGRDAVL